MKFILISRHTNVADVPVTETDQKAQRSPGLKFGFTHEVFPEISLDEAARDDVNSRR